MRAPPRRRARPTQVFESALSRQIDSITVGNLVHTIINSVRLMLRGNGIITKMINVARPRAEHYFFSKFKLWSTVYSVERQQRQKRPQRSLKFSQDRAPSMLHGGGELRSLDIEKPQNTKKIRNCSPSSSPVQLCMTCEWGFSNALALKKGGGAGGFGWVARAARHTAR